MPALKNIRHERFAREYVKTGIGAEAYRRAYPTARVRETSWVNASKLLRHTNVARRTLELRNAMLKRSDITLEKLLTDLETAKNLAHSLDKTGDMTNATMAQAKLVGLLTDRIEQRNINEFDDNMAISDIISAVRDQVGEQAAMALITAFGLNKPTAEQDKTPTVTGSDSVN